MNINCMIYLSGVEISNDCVQNEMPKAGPTKGIQPVMDIQSIQRNWRIMCLEILW